MRNSKRPKGQKQNNQTPGSKANTRKKSGKNTSGSNKFWKSVKIILLSIFLICLVGGVAVAGAGLAMIKSAPKLDVDKILTLDEPARIYDDQGNFMDQYITVRNRENISITEIPENLQNAFIAIEDERFREHNGIDWYRLAGAVKADIKILLGGSGSFQGASTITQQLIKQRLFYKNSVEDRLNPERKVQEMYLAWQLDKTLNKDKILEAYLNTIFLGGKSNGVKAAAKQYFDKDDLADLTLVECAFLASAAQNPSKSFMLSKQSAKDKDGVFYSERTLAILGKMLELGYLTQSEYDEATSSTTGDKAVAVNMNFSTAVYDKMNYEWFSRTVIDEVTNDFKAAGKSEEEIYNLLANGGLKIYATMNSDWQNSTQAILDDENTPEKTKAGDFSFPVNGDLSPVQKDLQASAVVMDYRTGEVKVIVGGRGEQGPLAYNRAASENFLRPPGSCIKPLTVYAPAIETKKLTAGSIVEDSPLNEEQRRKYNVKDVKSGGSILQYPRNAPNRYEGYLNLRYGLKASKNTVAMKTVDTVGLPTAANFGREFGIPINEMDGNSLASISLGQLSGQKGSGANPLIMATAYGTFGNNGVMTSPVVYSKVVSSNGEILLEPKKESKKVISPEASYIMYDMLKEPVTPARAGEPAATGSSAMLSNMETRGKTGTSGDKKDYWFTGFTPYYSCSIWVGNDDNTVIKNGANRIGSYYVGKIWNKVMTPIHEGLENKKAVEKPSSITEVAISKDSGTLPSKLTSKDPRGNRIYNELFIKGTAPTKYDNIHYNVKVAEKDGVEYLATKYTFPKYIKNKVCIKRDSKPFTGPGRQSYTLVDEKYEAPKEEFPVSERLKKFIDFWGIEHAENFYDPDNDNKPVDPTDPTDPNNGDNTDDENNNGENGNNGSNGNNENGEDDSNNNNGNGNNNNNSPNNSNNNDSEKDKNDKKEKKTLLDGLFN